MPYIFALSATFPVVLVMHHCAIISGADITCLLLTGCGYPFSCNLEEEISWPDFPGLRQSSFIQVFFPFPLLFDFGGP